MNLRSAFDRLMGTTRAPDAGCTIPPPPRPMVSMAAWCDTSPTICVEAYRGREDRATPLVLRLDDVVAWRDYYQGENVICPRSRQLVLIDPRISPERMARYGDFLRDTSICVRETSGEMLDLFDACGHAAAMQFCVFDGAGVYRDPARLPI